MKKKSSKILNLIKKLIKIFIYIFRVRERLLLFVLFLFIVSLVSTNSIKDSSQIMNFADCVNAGYKIEIGSPTRCITDDDQIFIENSEGCNIGNQGLSAPGGDTENTLCEDQCGDGVCNDVVCLGEGCPCGEDEQSCPVDCSKQDERKIPAFGLADPASKYCMDQGGTLVISEEGDELVNYCVLEDETECEVNSFFNKQCP